MTIIRGRWFPAHVVWPDGAEHRRAYVLLAASDVDDDPRSGLMVFVRPDDEPVRREAVDWERTVVPGTARETARGFEVHLADGSVALVTAGLGCKCGQLGRWAGPLWATAVQVRA